ncbi:MAG TPA: DUF4279 domain-containing protein [Gemmatimonadaceae bacterium]|jgi:hypothetical protein|nr:DUF4279 domain-containing protein [Gemmatimonadaceae bacterium]
MIGFNEEDDADEFNIPRLRVSLRIRGDALDPDFLTQQLGVAPSFSARKGEVTARRGRERLHTTGVWTFRLEVPPATELGEAIGHVLAALPEDATLWEEITSSFTAELFCGVFLENDNQSTVIQPDVLSALGRRGLPLSLDLFRR